jgi:hypothetical protein
MLAAHSSPRGADCSFDLWVPTTARGWAPTHGRSLPVTECIVIAEVSPGRASSHSQGSFLAINMATTTHRSGMLRRGGNWGLSRRDAAPPDRGGRCPAEPLWGLFCEPELISSIRWFIWPCVLNVSLSRVTLTNYHLNDLAPALRQGVNCTQSDCPGTRRTQYPPAEPHRPASRRGERGQFGGGDAALRSDHDH